MAPAYAVAAMLRDTGLTLQDFDYYEIHEAFAAVPLCLFKAWESADYCRERLGCTGAAGRRSTPRKLNVKGGSVAIGHPFAATGARILAVLAKLLARDPQCQARPGIGLHGRRHGGHGDPGARMSQSETLMARDGHAFSAYIAKPAGQGARRGRHRAGDLRPDAHMCGGSPTAMPAEGYLAVAPALFDRVRAASGARLFPAGGRAGAGLSQTDRRPPRRCWTSPQRRPSARHAGRVAVHRLLLGWHARLGCRQRGAAGRRGVLLRRRHRRISCPRRPRCPTLLHFGEQDKTIPLSDIEQLRSGLSAGESTTSTPPGHAFSNDDRPDHYNAEASALARARTHAFLAQHIG